jgi:hypothetical protein
MILRPFRDLGGVNFSLARKTPPTLFSAQAGSIHYYSSYVTRDVRPVHRNSGLVTERNLNVRTATLRVGHLARGLYATVTTRIHFDWTTSFLSDTLILISKFKAVNGPWAGNLNLIE